MAKREYTDISQTPIAKGDVVIVLDDDNPEIAYTLRISRVETDTERAVRRLTATVISVSETIEGVSPGQVIPVEISMSTPTRGIVMKNVDLSKDLTFIEQRESIVSALIEYLNTKPDQNYRSTYDTLIAFLQSGGYYDQTIPYDQCKKRLTQLLRDYDKYFRISGKYISYTGRPFASAQDVEIVRHDPRQKRVKFGKMMQGIRLILESLGYSIDD